MYQDLPRHASFWLFLFAIDQDLAESTRQKACPCGGRLHCAHYPRKPRGIDDLPDAYRYRLSFCCDRDGCRKRRVDLWVLSGAQSVATGSHRGTALRMTTNTVFPPPGKQMPRAPALHAWRLRSGNGGHPAIVAEPPLLAASGGEENRCL